MKLRHVLTKVIGQGLLDWKMPIGLGALYAFVAFTTAYTGQLKQYNEAEAIGDLQWSIIWQTSLASAATALIAFCSRSVARTEDKIVERNGEQPTFTKELEKPTEPKP